MPDNPLKIIEKRDKQISESIQRFSDKLPLIQRQIWAELLILIKSLDIDSEGKIKPSSANIKLVRTFTTTKLKKIVKSSDYQGSIKQFMKAFDMVSTETDRYFKTVKDADSSGTS